MTIKLRYLLLIIIVSAAFGRFMAPESVKRQSETLTTENTKKEETKNVQLDSQRDKRVEKQVEEIVRPDGTKETRTRVVEDTTTTKRVDTAENDRQESSTTTAQKSSEEITYGRGKLIISALAGASPSMSGGLSLGPIVYGGHVQKSILGPIMIGAWAVSTGTGGISLGLTF